MFQIGKMSYTFSSIRSDYSLLIACIDRTIRESPGAHLAICRCRAPHVGFRILQKI
jgi:hypothetical protein